MQPRARAVAASFGRRPRADRITFLTHYYPPEVGAPQTRIHETARILRRLGRDVRVITGPPHYPDGIVQSGYRALSPSREMIDGVPIARLPVLVRPNRGILDRTIDQASFALSAFAAAGMVGAADAFIVESPPLFLGITAAILGRLTGRPYIYHVADPWPDFPIEMGALDSRIAQDVAFAIEAMAYRHAAFVTTVSPGLCQLLERKPEAAGKVRLLPNGVDLGRFDATADAGDARRALGWEPARLTLAYVGSVGLAQGVGTLIEAVAPLAGDGVALHIVGDGYERADLRSFVEANGWRNIWFHDPVAADAVPRVLAAADAVAVLLRRGSIYEHALPTKLVEGLAAARPIVISADGDVVRLVRDDAAGVSAPAENPAALRQQILGLLDADRVAMGQAARGLAASRFSRERIVEDLVALLDEAVADSAARSRPADSRGRPFGT